MKRVALFLDGTWADPASATNVWQLHELAASAGEDGALQIVRHFHGVGAQRSERLRGGMFGFGLLRNVAAAYSWLVGQHEDGDEIFLFGYSRGAYTARSVAGVIARCGLLRAANGKHVDRVMQRYRIGDRAAPMYRLERLSQPKRAALRGEDAWLLAHSRRVNVRFIGVWDTVGALGVPFGNLPLISRRAQQFHNTNPSVIYENLYQALGIDENRRPYDATLWTDFQAAGQGPPEPSPHQRIEQRWFVGAHSNVGGGGSDNDLARIPLAWIAEKAQELGFRFEEPVVLSGSEHLADVRDSYRNFLKGLYPLLRLGRGRHWRQIGRPPRPTRSRPGLSYTLNETIDASVFERWRAVPGFRPPNLRDWATRTGHDLEELTTSVAAE